jgi:hypothetical protein
MKNTLVVAIATTLLSTVAFAEDRQVTVDLPKTITVTCSDSVPQGTVVLTNPPKFSCADYDVVNRVIGTGISVGPDTRISRILRAVRRAEKPSRIISASKRRRNNSNGDWSDINQSKNIPPSYWQDGFRKGAWQPLDDFDRRFPGMNRNRAWFEKKANTDCTGMVNINDLLSGKCKNARVRVN